MPWSPEVSLKSMDAIGTEKAILSLPMGSYSRVDARQYNELAVKYRQEYPGRFGFFATLPNLHDTEGALSEIAYSLDELKADGIALTSSYPDLNGGEASYLGDDLYDPILEELNKRHAVVFLHGAQTPSSTPIPHAFLGLPITEVPNETYKAAAHLVVTGKKRRYPDIKIILAHLGGTTVFLAPRVAILSRHMGSPLTPEEILEDFKSFYFDTALAGYETNLVAMRNFVGSDRILFGTDFPAVSTQMIEWFTKNVEDFYEAGTEIENVMRGNALKLLPEHT
ncbi:hypothetical protein JAAARDRAFT_64434 [Jaapia argillacea MUCL 33604]|uniref:Amidohydrolase-related domain-containing protein n=1 Tax=Jaapia argillacea MUCL 33604 TaxID=933084 RepID=A0A067QEI2_9AGAM|nr:hypothetical protein JAAARDRAFT_64434 [Jaapia argillacea MUCL 33604]